MNPGREPLVSVIVVNYNGGPRTQACVSAVARSDYPKLEILLIDNASSDGSWTRFGDGECAGRPLLALRNERNLGYAAAVNLVLPVTRGDYVAVLNMDVEVEPGWLGPLVSFLESNTGCAAANPLIVLPGGERVNALGQDVHVTGLGFNRGLGRLASSVSCAPFPVSGIQGACFLARRSALEEVGGMDASGFLYHEDVNLSWMLRLAGYTLACVPSSIVTHDYFLSMYPLKLYLLERNRWMLLLTCLRWPTLILLLPFLAVTEALIFIYGLIRGPSYLLAKLSAWRSVLGRRRAIAARRRAIRRLRSVSDIRLLRGMRLAYDWRQFLHLARERGASPRQPSGVPRDV